MAGLSVLVVDDSRADRFLMGWVLGKIEGLGPIEFCRDAEEALAWLRANPMPDIIFVDINMPRMNGFELLEAVQAEFADLSGSHVAILSSSSWRDDRKRASGMALISNYFTKPLAADALRGWLQDLGSAA